MLGEKSLACLAIAEARYGTPEEHGRLWRLADDAFRKANRDALYDEACARWSEKAVCRKFEELADRGYIEYGVSARTGWLTEKGQAAMDASRAAVPHGR